MPTKLDAKKTNRQINGLTKYKKRDPLVKLVAEDCGCSERQVRNIINGITGNRRVTALAEMVTIAYALRRDAAERTTQTIRQHLKK